MAGLLGNIATAAGNNMAQYAHTKQRQDFQGEQLKSQQDHMTKLEEWRMERKEKMALRSRDWAVEDRDAQINGLLGRERIKADQASQESEQGQFNQQVKFAREDLGQINEEVSKLSSAIRGYDPMTDPDGQGVARLQEELSRLESRRSMVMEAIPDGVLESAGPLLNATHRELQELSNELRNRNATEQPGEPVTGQESGVSSGVNREAEPSGLMNTAFNDDWRAQQDYHNERRAKATDFWKELFKREAPGTGYKDSRGNF